MTQQPDTRPGLYYVTAIRDDGKTAFLAGPFVNDHAGALVMVDRARDIACDVDPRAHWYSYGTARWKGHGPYPKGKLNDKLGLDALGPEA